MHGTQFWMEVFCLPIAGLIVVFVYLPILYKLNLSSSYQYLEKRFNATVSKLCLFSIFLPVMMLIPLCIYASSLIFNQGGHYPIHHTHIVKIISSEWFRCFYNSHCCFINLYILHCIWRLASSNLGGCPATYRYITKFKYRIDYGHCFCWRIWKDLGKS